jgi:hypothetical protein
MLNQEYIQLRLLAGYLGEKTQFNWWASSFLDPNGKAFLQPSFPKTYRLSQYHGVLEAARGVHDDYIGVGRVYHLFRLPEELEHSLHDSFSEPNASERWFEGLSSREDALERLHALAKGAQGSGEGPMTIGDEVAITMPESIPRLAGVYWSAFSSGIRTYPYFKTR